MNLHLQKLMSRWFRLTVQHQDPDRGISSRAGTRTLRDAMVLLFDRHGIKYVFDSGCNDCIWARELGKYITYSGGDNSPGPVAEAWAMNPDLDIRIHDCTTDEFPMVDCLLSRDVVIHLNQDDRHKFVANWLRSGIPWLLVTQQHDIDYNANIEYSEKHLADGPINWCIEPWYWPKPVDYVPELVTTVPGKPLGRCLALWHRDQIKGLL